MIDLATMTSVMTLVATLCVPVCHYGRTAPSEKLFQECIDKNMECLTKESNGPHGLTAISLTKCLGPESRTKK